MFDFGNANANQRSAISAVNGPVLITAGPGTGKTYTLVQRAIYLIEECGVKPENIFIATFTEKAAKELLTRITNEFASRNVSVNINEMYLGTFHSLCLRIIREHIEFSNLKRNYRLLDSFDQQYTIYQNLYSRFKKIEGFDIVFGNNSSWQQAADICTYVNNLTEELVEPKLLIQDSDPNIQILGNVYKTYRDILKENNMIDFASIQSEAYYLLKNNPNILSEIKAKISHIMIDEYQDTNFIQEQIVFMLGGDTKNICVVGDDDQGLYRFRGATIRNILEFPFKFAKNECQIIPLVVNYRSNSDIVDFYNRWMLPTNGSDKKNQFEWGRFRYEKEIIAHKVKDISSPGVIKIYANDDEDKWCNKIYDFIIELKNSGKLSDYNQIAFLFKSVKSPQATKLANYLEENGINVYSPRSNMFFERNEIKLILGCYLIMFPMYVAALEDDKFKFLHGSRFDYSKYYFDCIEYAIQILEDPKHNELKNFLLLMQNNHINLSGTTDYAYSTLLYRLFEFEPFTTIIGTDIESGVVDVRPLRNISIFSQIIGKFEYLHNISVLSDRFIEHNTEMLFNNFLRFLIGGGISEYEDDSEYAPSGCVSFLTVHQAKGMEFPIVFVGLNSKGPVKNENPILMQIENKYYSRKPFEPMDKTKYYDFWRLYYTAFSRAQDLLILTSNETNRTPHKAFSILYNELVEPSSSLFNIDEFEFHDVKDVNIKTAYSFTSHITVYETCAMQYKFYKELSFTPVRAGGMLFGRLVHETIEDVHRAVLRGEAETITTENIEKWFHTNYEALSKAEHSYLVERQQDAALSHVQRYVERQHGDWSMIQQAEVDVSLVKPDYIIEGKIDLIKGDDSTVEIVDFKSEKKPDMVTGKDRIEHYRRQLNIYAYLVEERTGLKVSKMHLYYTGSKEDEVPTITFKNTRTSLEGTMASFDKTVHKIMNKDFSYCANKSDVCRNCDFRFYCGQR
ncbi:MAG: ATP-dependent helicase [Lachnospiraceae bacterium]|nr:ATP-dependent helicase [Lachnospiraceae bacterium]